MGARSIIYIDGFNFYYGVMKSSKYKWLDIQKYFEKIRQDDDIQQIYYFTAMVSGIARDRQEIYFKALRTSPLIKLVLGTYKTRERKCKVSNCTNQLRKYQDSEEKKTDVNIALQMLDDAYQGKCDRMVVVSGDSDLTPAILMVKKRFPEIKISVYVPSKNSNRGAASEIRNAAHKDATLPTVLFSKSQFPENLLDNAGTRIYKPVSW